MNYPDRKHLIIGLVLVVAIIFGLGYKAGQTKGTDLQPIIETGAETKQEVTPSKIVTVHVAGAVERPGVYTYPEGTRINEGLSKAGPLKEAELSYINLAEIMTDQQQIIVPRRGQDPPNRSAAASTGSNSGYLPAVSPSGKVNINTAGASALEKLPGIGPVTAKKIIDYRTANGRFNDINELMKVEGIGEKKFARLKEKVLI